MIEVMRAQPPGARLRAPLVPGRRPAPRAFGAATPRAARLLAEPHALLPPALEPRPSTLSVENPNPKPPLQDYEEPNAHLPEHSDAKDVADFGTQREGIAAD